MNLLARSFDLTSDKILLNVWISVAAAAASCVLCLFVLLGAAWIYSKPYARHAINRVSFRLLLWSMVFEVFYDAAFIAVGVESAVPGASEAACATGVYFMVSTLAVVNYLCTCIAVNLMLIVCFKINPIEKRLERWYVGVSVFVGMVVPIGPAIKQHFGFDPVLHVCWIQAQSDGRRMVNFIVDLYLWQTISCIVATLAVIATLIKLFKQRRHLASRPDHLNQAFSIDLEDPHDRESIFSHLQNRFLKIAILISLYPISLIIVNGIITIGDLYISAEGGVRRTGMYGLYCIYYFLYGGRGIVFACLGIFVDPCFRNGLKAAWAGDKNQNLIPIAKDPNSKASLLEILGAPTPLLGYDSQIVSASEEQLSIPFDRSRQESKASIEMVAALSRVPMEFSSPSPNALRPQTSLKRDYSRTFSGVQAEALPEGLTDDVDVRVPVSHVDADGRWVGERMTDFDPDDLQPLDPDLPDAIEEKRRKRKAQQVDKEDAIRQFQETQAQL